MKTISSYLKLLRIRQWVKNCLVLAPLFFSQSLFVWDSVVKALLAFLSFSLFASTMYVLNDLADIEKDRNHPVKKNRPLASGVISPEQGKFVVLVLAITGLAAGFLVNLDFLTVVGTYVILNILYTKWFKHIVILDVLTISLGFVLRALAGAVAISVIFSDWLLMTTLFLALFLGLGKRRHELLLLNESAGNHRKVLKGYTSSLLDQLITIVATASLLSFALYTQSTHVVERFGTTHLVYTLPIAVYGLFRYFYLVYQRDEGGDPTETLLTDPQLFLSVLIWVVSVVVIIYT